MDVSPAVDALQKFFIQFVCSLEAEADKSHLNFGDNFKARIFEAEFFKLLGESDVTSEVGLKINKMNLRKDDFKSNKKQSLNRFV